MGGSKRFAEYRRRRRRARSGEPQGGRSKGRAQRFVVQKHDASHLHYDFRLEIDGVLASWAVPKGPSLDPSDKRLAVRTEDHPLEYATFEGVIPEGEYGAGTVMVWDRGSYRNLRDASMKKSLRDGQIEVRLAGRKLHGGYVLRRMTKGKKARWLLIKKKDRHADRRRNPVASRTRSVKTGRSLRRIAREEA